MTVAMAVAVGGLFAVGTYLVVQRNLTRILLGLVLMAHGANLALLGSGGRAGAPPLAGQPGSGSAMADPVPQALALTAIVISFGLTAFVLALAGRAQEHTGGDEVEDDVEDRRIAALAERERDRAGRRRSRPSRRRGSPP